MKNFGSMTSKFMFLIIGALLISAAVKAEPITRLLIIGNSITSHKPNADLGWSGSWGMAASRQEKDFSHVLATMLEQVQEGQRPVLYPKTVYGFEQNTGAFDFGRLEFVEFFRPDAVVVFLGDNVKLEQYEAHLFGKQYEKLLAILAGNTERKLYCVSTWWANPKVDSLISTTCRSKGGRFVDIKNLSGRPGMKATLSGQFSNAGVAAHPSDEGMEEIAKSIFSSMKEKL
jgi:hypothetical protein